MKTNRYSYTLLIALISGLLAADQTANANQPDLHIGKGFNTLKGDNVYNTNAAGQKIRRSTRNARNLAFSIKVENDSQNLNSALFRGPGGNRHFRVRYEQSNEGNVTALVRNGYFLPDAPPGESALFRVHCRVRPSAKERRFRKTMRYSVYSTLDPAFRDSAWARLRRNPK